MSHWYKAARCQEVINITIVVHKVAKNSFSTSNSSFLPLLDTAQLCQLAGDTQYVAKQNQFDALNLITKLNSTGKTWSITGQVETRVSRTQNNMQFIGVRNIDGYIGIQNHDADSQWFI